MCGPCKEAADLRREIGGLFRRHPCAYPHTCTCQHNKTKPIPVGRRKGR